MKVAVYARVSTVDQTAENQLIELRRYVSARGWSAVEYINRVSGAKDRRRARPTRRRCAAPSRASRRVLATRSPRQKSSPLGVAARRLALARHRVRHAWARGSTRARPPAGSSQGSSARSRSSSVRAFKSAFELASRGCAHKAGAWAANPAPSRTISLRRSRHSSTRQAGQRLRVSHTVVARWRAVNKTPLEDGQKPPILRPLRNAAGCNRITSQVSRFEPLTRTAGCRHAAPNAVLGTDVAFSQSQQSHLRRPRSRSEAVVVDG